jgi:hypothetical protein
MMRVHMTFVITVGLPLDSVTPSQSTPGLGLSPLTYLPCMAGHRVYRACQLCKLGGHAFSSAWTTLLCHLWAIHT